ncbi:MAG: amidohydrolase family protein [Erysipelotrichaceae bacterium]|nr:amidohydrolase family protein [Erysipelotrichaceae bacterium]
MAKYLFTHGHLIIDDRKEFEDGALLVDGDKILDVYPHTNKVEINEECTVIDLHGQLLMPGFFDSHTHGLRGVDFNNASNEEIDSISIEYAKKGTTSILNSLTDIRNFDNLECEYLRCLGTHLEGPFISEKYKGSHIAKEIDVSLLNDLNNCKQMTIAPELENSELLIEALNKRNIKVMFGHSDARYKDIKDYKHDGFTHLFNASSPYHHRDLGLVNLALAEKDRYVEVIAEESHLDLSVIKLIMNEIDKDKLILVSDSKEDTYLLNGLKNLRKLGASNTDLVAYSSLNAYRLYGMDKRYGSLIKGRCADFVVLNDDLDVVMTYVKGKIINV